MSSATIASLRASLTAVADPALAPGMAAYMKDQFPFLGVKSGPRKQAQRSLIAAAKTVGEADLLALAAELFDEPEREFAYVACDVLRRWAGRLGPDSIGPLRELIQTKSWWDTVDVLAVHVVGAVVRANRDLVWVMDGWIEDPDIWVARTAILHQLMWKADTDADRLFAYCDLRGGDKEFFIRKALGWALRQYARTDAEAVALYVAENAERLSGLTKREALKHIG
ncbi:DNA alkylation repair protein [Nocardioides sp.]|uniref:DNA alkylation repair protein n=1 Tax=Nocardioides sp. TaxID=35761 RepID=UPI0035631EFD